MPEAPSRPDRAAPRRNREPATIAHHVPEESLLEYAAGSSSEAHALVIATHLTLCPRCQQELTVLEALGGAVLEQQDVSTCPSSWPWPRSVGAAARVPARKSGAVTSDGVLPRPLLDYTGPLHCIPWQTAFGGAIAYVELPVAQNGVPVRLKRVRPGVRIPAHGHSDLELELVLSGGATDSVGNREYRRGDVAVNDPATIHDLTVDPGEACLILGVHGGPLVPAGLRSRLVYGWLGWSR